MSLFFKPRHKAQKDRAILKRVDQTLSRQGLPSALLHFVLFIIIEWYLLNDAEAPKAVYFFGLALVVMAAWRFIMIAQFDSWYAKGPASWRDTFILSGFFHAAIWSTYLAYRLTTMPENSIMLLGILYTAAIAAGGTFVYSLYGKTVRVYLMVLLAPLAAYFLMWGASTVNVILGIGLIAMYFYLVSTAHRVSDLVWSFLASNHEYKLRLSVLEQAREANTVENSSNRRFIQQILMRVKNPLSGLLGVLGMLTVDDRDTENQGMLNIARRSGYSILDLITDLEAFIEQRDQARVPQSVVFNLRKTLEHALSDMGPKAHENGRELSYLYHPDVPERIEADPQWLSNAFRRLLDFTIDMADSGEITVRIGMNSEQNKDCLQMSFYFTNNEIEESDLTAALERQMDVLPENEDVADQLTLMVATAQFKAMGAKLSATSKGDLNKVTVKLPISTTSQQASSFRPAKYMSGKSILLVDLSQQNERSLTAEFMSWNMNVAVWTMERLVAEESDIETDFIFVNVPVDDQRAIQQAADIQTLTKRLSNQTHIILYSSELQRNLFKGLESHYTFVEKPVARDQLLSALREANEHIEVTAEDTFRCENSKVLIAEDNLLNQKVVLRLLEETGISTDTCVNGEEAIQLATTGNYSLILMDCFMPRMNGLEATRTIRQAETDTGSHIPIVAMTSEQTPELERECLAAGMDDFLSKPMQKDTLLEVLQRWTG
jgi:CheY-like chemotaxis protein/signal transduction histidine kinase